MSKLTTSKRLLETALWYCETEGLHPTPLRELSMFRMDRRTEVAPAMYHPSLCFVVQGEKDVWTGKKLYRYDPDHYLVSCLDLPATAQVVEASPKQPFVCLILELQPSVVYEILQASRLGGIQNQGSGGEMFVEKVTPELADAIGRLVGILKNNDELELLAPSIVREIHFRLMISRFGVKVRQLGIVGSKTQRIGTVINQLRKDFATPVRVSELARVAGMSLSTFHLHFRHATNMSPLQYQKQIRLQEARRLLSVEILDAASVAFKVGYESPSQFSREYKRLFGEPPMRDMDRLRSNDSSVDHFAT